MHGADMHKHTFVVGMCCIGTSLRAAFAQRNIEHALKVLAGQGMGWRVDSYRGQRPRPE